MNIRTAGVLVFAGIGLVLGAATALAHHAFSAEFDASKPVKLRGKVTKVEWINPHAWIHIDVKAEDGKVTPWMIKAAAPNALLRRGWTKNSLAAGTEILVEGYQSKDGSNRANGSIITFTDGKKLFVGSSAGDPGAAPGAPSREPAPAGKPGRPAARRSAAGAARCGGGVRRATRSTGR